jgi:L-aspartate-alpha-decarboxylase
VDDEAGDVSHIEMPAGTIEVVRAKLHDIRVTGADLNYHGSVTLDPEHCEEVGILPLEFVEVWNKASGARLSTYVIWGERGSRCCILNGAAARTCQVGDPVIIVARLTISPSALVQLRPRVAVFDAENRIIDRLEYRVHADDNGALRFETVRMRG